MIASEDERLLREWARSLHISRPAVRPLSRFGRSGAQIYVLQSASGGGYPHAVKIGPTDKIQKELEAARRVSAFIHGAKPVIYEAMETRSRAALCYELLTAKSSSDEILELDSVYEKALANDESAVSQCRKYMTEIYRDMAPAHVKVKPQPRTYADIFERYLRRREVDRVGTLFATHDSVLDVGGHSVAINPLSVQEDLLLKTTQAYLVEAVHGDLHLSNVVINNGIPRLIDFAWAGREDHLAKDFVLMESSIRFMRFPRDIHPKLLLSVDAALNSEWAVATALSIIEEMPHEGARRRLLAVSRLVADVRSAFEDAVRQRRRPRHEWTKEYFTCLFLVLSGQQRFDTFPLLRTTINLDQLRRCWVESET